MALQSTSQPPKRIQKESCRLKTEKIPGITVYPNEKNVRHFVVLIIGPSDSPYEGGKFYLEVYLPHEYPMSPPKVVFDTKIYHPNIDKLGRICLDILKDKWSPALQIRTVLLSIQALLASPNPDDPLNNQVAEQWNCDEKLAMDTAKAWTMKYAALYVCILKFGLDCVQDCEPYRPKKDDPDQYGQKKQ